MFQTIGTAEYCTGQQPYTVSLTALLTYRADNLTVQRNISASTAVKRLFLFPGGTKENREKHDQDGL
jgi:hypothetical protein